MPFVHLARQQRATSHFRLTLAGARCALRAALPYGEFGALRGWQKSLRYIAVEAAEGQLGKARPASYFGAPTKAVPAGGRAMLTSKQGQPVIRSKGGMESRASSSKASSQSGTLGVNRASRKNVAF
ncbi:uncharacterized protein TrAFT101_007424 [Trichoderma asperellum]|uniref:uncharacterized protein n=1 Tax=Trichoderma asperellum TaxID=101201 RepID=UPI003331A57F|nr:hypothetical protein TrAFT101_007424 [Trichoderma asperellum]